MRENVKLYTGDAMTVLKTLPDESVQCCVTSPPYWGLRDYGTATWEGGDAGCDHRNGRFQRGGMSAKQASNPGSGGDEATTVCPKCGARRIDAQLGLEPTPEGYVAKMVGVFREVRRVLRRDGTLWLNIGDSYNAMQGKGFKPEGGRNIAAAPTIKRPMPAGIKPKDLVGIPWMLAFALRADGWWLRSEIIWCLSHSTRVYAQTQKGEMPMTVGEMIRLNPKTVKLWTGEKWAQVEGFEHSQDSEGIELALRNGQRISCTRGHRWPTTRGEVLADDLRVGDRLLSVTLPEPFQPTIPGGIPDSMGWLVGFYLAEGSHLKDGMQFSMNANEDTETYLLEEFGEFYGSSVTTFDYGNGRQVHIRGGATSAIVREYVWGDDCKHKHLTTSAWQRSNAFLKNVLKGYLDGDAHYEADTKRYRLGFARNDALADDLRTLGARLGVSVRLRRAWHKNQTGAFYGWRGEVRMDRTQRRTADEEIVGIQRSKSSKFYDIAVEEPHVFALASGILTHNSKPNPMPESVTDRPTKSHEQVFLLTKAATYYWDAEAVREPLVRDDDKHPRTRSDAKTTGLLSGERTDPSRMEPMHSNPAGRNLRSVWNIATQPFSGAHFATMPQKLAETCIKAGTSERGACGKCGGPWERVVEKETHFEGGSGKAGRTAEDANAAGKWAGIQYGTNIKLGPVNSTTTLGWQPTCSCGETNTRPCVVLDPFSGAGTTGLVATRLGRDYIGIELNPAYNEMARARCAEVQPRLPVAVR